MLIRQPPYIRFAFNILLASFEVFFIYFSQHVVCIIFMLRTYHLEGSPQNILNMKQILFYWETRAWLFAIDWAFNFLLNLLYILKSWNGKHYTWRRSIFSLKWECLIESCERERDYNIRGKKEAWIIYTYILYYIQRITYFTNSLSVNKLH